VCHTCMTGLIGGSTSYNSEVLERSAPGNGPLCKVRLFKNDGESYNENGTRGELASVLSPQDGVNKTSATAATCDDMGYPARHA
jgi:hypothetical protein